MKILIIKPSSFGDIIQANPVATALKSVFANCSISWLVFDKFSAVVDLFENIDSKIIWNRNGGLKEFFLVVAKLRKMNFDIVIDLQGLFRTALLARLSGAKKIIGVPGLKEFSNILIKEVPHSEKLNAVNRNLQTVNYLTNINFKPVFNIVLNENVLKNCKEKFSYLKNNDGQILIAVVVSARGVGKQWDINNYSAVINLLINKYSNVKIVLLGLENEFNISNERVINLQSKTTISELTYLLSQCLVVLGGDTGPMHLASAVGIKVVMLFGASDVNETAPIAENAVILNKPLPCAPCRGSKRCKDYKCINSISVNFFILNLFNLVYKIN